MYAASLSKDNTLLRLSGVSKAFGPRVLFRKLGAEFKAESITLLAGSNGTGKSTLMRIMAGLGRPDSGTVERLADETETAFLAHATFIYSGLSARENLLFSAKLAEEAGFDTSRVLIVTSDFHMCRAKYIAKTLGMEPYGLTSSTWPWILKLNYTLREVFAFCKAVYQAHR